MRYDFLILDTHRPDTLYLREQGCEDFLKPKGSANKKVWETVVPKDDNM